MLSNISSALSPLNFLQLSCTWKADLQCHWNAILQCSFHSMFLPFHLHFSFWNLEPTIVSLSIKAFLSVFSSLVGIHLTCSPKPCQHYCQFPSVSCTSLDHGAQVVHPLGLELVGTVLQSTCAEFQDVSSNICFALLDLRPCLAFSARHSYWWSSMYRNNSSPFGFWSSTVVKAGCRQTLSSKLSRFLPAGFDLFDFSCFWAQATLWLIHWESPQGWHQHSVGRAEMPSLPWEPHGQQHPGALSTATHLPSLESLTLN